MADLDDALRTLIREIVRTEVAAAVAGAVTAARGAEYLSTEEAGEHARVTPGTIRRWIAEGRLQKYGAGREIRVQRDALELLMRGPRRRRSRTADVVNPEARGARIAEGIFGTRGRVPAAPRGRGAGKTLRSRPAC